MHNALQEYISVGKGRDVGFDQINGFEAKVSGMFFRLPSGDNCVLRGHTASNREE